MRCIYIKDLSSVRDRAVFITDSLSFSIHVKKSCTYNSLTQYTHACSNVQ